MPPTSPDVSWVDVLPNMSNFLPELTKKLGGTLGAAGTKAGTDFGGGFQRAALNGVETASNQLVAARRKVEDAAGRVRVAEARLQDVMASGKATSAQLAAAQENLAATKRKLDGANEAVAASTRKVATAQQEAARAGRDTSAVMDRQHTQGGQMATMLGNIQAGWMKVAGAAYGLVTLGNFLGGAIKSASDLNETINKSNIIFGVNAGKVDEWSKTAARSVGMSRQAALEAAAGFGNLFTQLGFSATAAADMSTSTVQMSADLGSFNNLPTAEVAEMISAAFRGEYDSLQRLIPAISDARVKSEAMAMTGKTNAESLTQQEKAAAVLAIVQRDGAAAMGDFARTSGNLANQQKILSAEWDNAKAKLGGLMVGPATLFVGWLTDVIPKVETFGRFLRDNLAPILAGVGTAVAIVAGPTALGLLGSVLGLLLSPVVLIAGAVAGLTLAFQRAYDQSEPLRAAIGRIKESFDIVLNAFRTADADGGVAGFFQRVVAGVQAAWPTLRSALADAGRALWAWIQEAVPPALEALGRWAGSVTSWVVGTALPWLLGAMASLGGALVEWIAPRIGPALGKLGEWLAAIGGWVWNTALPAVGGALASMGAALVDWVSPRIGPALGKLGEWLGAIVNWVLTTALPAVGGALLNLGGKLVGWVAENIGPTLGKLGEWLGALVTWVWDEGLPRLGTALADLGRSLVDWVTPKIPELLGKLGEFLGSAVGWIVGTGIPMLVGGLLKLAWELVTWVLPRLPDLLIEFGKFVAGIVSWLITTGLPALATGLWNFATSAISSFWEAIGASPVIQKVSEVFTSVKDTVGGIVGGMRDAVVGFVQEMWDGAVQRFTGLRDGAVALAQALWDGVVARWTGMRDTVVGIAQALWDLVVARLTGLRDGAVNLAQELWTWVADRWNGLLTQTQAIWQSLVDWVIGLVTGFRDTVVNLAQMVHDWVRDRWNLLLAITQAIWQALVDWVVGLVTGFRDRAVALAQELATWVGDRFQGLRDRAQSIWQGMVDTVVGVFTGFRDRAAGIAQEVWDTVAGKFGGMRDKAVEIFRDLVDKAGTIWDGIKAKLRDPINWVIREVWNGGIAEAWNAVAGVLGIGKIGTLAEIGAAAGGQVFGPITDRADGGQVPNYANGGPIRGKWRGPRADNILGIVDNKAPLKVNPREWLHPVDAVDFYGDDVMRAMQHRKLPRELLRGALRGDYDEHGRDMHHLAHGGPIPRAATGMQIFNVTKAAFPRAKVNSTYRAGGTSFHGKNPPHGQAADMGEAGFPGGVGRQYIADMDAWWVQNYGRTANEIIYNGVGNRATNIKNGAPSAYSAAIQAQHRDHLHVAYAGALSGATGGPGGPGIIQSAVDFAASILADLMGKIGSLFEGPARAAVAGIGKLIGDPPPRWKEMPPALGNKVIDEALKFMKGKAQTQSEAQAAAMAAPTGTAANVIAASGSVQEIVRAVASGYGWGNGPQWDALHTLIQKESSWRPTADNPASTAYGLFQFLDSTWASVGATRTSDPRLQAIAGLKYIAQRYGTPSAALAFHLKNNWYGKGGQIPGLEKFWTGGQVSPQLPVFHRGGSTERWKRDGLAVLGPRERVLAPQQDRVFRRMTDTLDHIDQRGARGDTHISVQMQESDPYRVADVISHKLRVADRGGVYRSAAAPSSTMTFTS